MKDYTVHMFLLVLITCEHSFAHAVLMLVSWVPVNLVLDISFIPQQKNY